MTRRSERKGRRGRAGNVAVVSAGVDPQQLLPIALKAHQQGDLERARKLYQQVLSAHPQHTDALQFAGLLSHQQGDTERGLDLIRRAIALRGDVAPYHDNLGAVLESVGQFNEALEAFSAAEALDGNDAERDYNIAVVLTRLRRFNDAVPRYRRALSARAGDRDVLFGLANALKASGEMARSREVYLQLLAIDPQHVDGRVNFANLLQGQGCLEQARDMLRSVLAGRADHHGARYNLGSVLREQGELDEALACFRQVAREATNDASLGPRAALACATVLEQLGDAVKADDIYRRYATHEVMGEAARDGLLRLLSVWTPSTVRAIYMRVLVDGVGAGRVAAAAVSRAAFGLLSQHYALSTDPSSDVIIEVAPRLGGDALFRLMCERAVNTEATMEQWLTRARALLLLDRSARERCASLLQPLAQLCGGNEFVFAQSDAETLAVSNLRDELSEQLAQCPNAPVHPSLKSALLIYGAYCSIATVPAFVTAIGERVLNADVELAWLFQRDVTVPKDEANRAGELTTIGKINDAASCVVRAQYEENPYPRWTELPVKSSNVLPHAIARHHLDLVRQLNAGEGQVLVAGCGTGQEALVIARSLPNASILAMDLSVASLAYAERMAERHQLHNVSFVHGDLLNVAQLERQFDLVFASGVLHHMAQPERGLDALLKVLARGGLMKVALYSRAARLNVQHARERIASLGLSPDAAGIRRIRAQAFEHGDPILRSLVDSDDFYTLSTCRDLLFHSVEHTFTLSEIERLLASRELEFLGFDLPYLHVQHQFLKQHPQGEQDLAAWQHFEAQQPDVFAAMYRFWTTLKQGESDA